MKALNKLYYQIRHIGEPEYIVSLLPVFDTLPEARKILQERRMNETPEVGLHWHIVRVTIEVIE
jgi:hypothetical protein